MINFFRSSNDYKKIIDFMIHDVDERSIDGVCASFDHFLQNVYKAESLMVCTYSVKGNGLMRFVFNRSVIEGKQSDDFKSLALRTAISGDKIFKFGGFNYYILNLGKMDKQHCIGIFSKRSDKFFSRVTLPLIENLFAKSLAIAREFKKLRDENILIHIDDVTHLYNQRKMIVDLNDLIERNKKYNKSFAVLFIDLDHFKSVNDNYGHVVGSNLLCQVSTIFRDNLRETDYIYRYGGDEFVIFIPECGETLSLKIANRLLSIIKTKKFNAGENNPVINLSASIGVANYPQDAESLTEILDFADKMMYEAKSNGRGMVRQARV